tara:strand:- start:620 stop:748 length:129 start_codon:yes stop_codon:yes gene_type:complete
MLQVEEEVQTLLVLVVVELVVTDKIIQVQYVEVYQLQQQHIQ